MRILMLLLSLFVIPIAAILSAWFFLVLAPVLLILGLPLFVLMAVFYLIKPKISLETEVLGFSRVKRGSAFEEEEASLLTLAKRLETRGCEKVNARLFRFFKISFYNLTQIQQQDVLREMIIKMVVIQNGEKDRYNIPFAAAVVGRELGLDHFRADKVRMILRRSPQIGEYKNGFRN